MKALDLATYIINKSIDIKKPVSNLQLQKMIYFVNLYYFRLTKTFLLDGEPFEAWQHGPVVPEVYREYSTYGGLLIKDKGNNIKLDSMIDSKQSNITNETIASINDFIVYLSSMDPWTLVDYSHRIGGAWYKSYNKDEINLKIRNELIKHEANS